MRACFIVVLGVSLAACASRDLWPIERVDPDTAVHVTVMAEPWIYALDDRRLSANNSHFLNVAVVETNRTGARSYWLNVVAWNTSTRGRDVSEGASAGSVAVQLGWPAKQLPLTAAVGGRAAAGVTEPAISVPGARTSEAWFPLSAAQVAQLGSGAPTSISLIDAGGQSQSYASWQVDDEAIAGFLKATGTGLPSD